MPFYAASVKEKVGRPRVGVSPTYRLVGIYSVS